MSLKHFAVLGAAGLLLSLAWAATPWDGGYSPVHGGYLAYSNGLKDRRPPTPDDHKLSFMVEGPLARQMFDAIGPDLEQVCGGSSASLRVRERGDLDCSFDKDDPRSPYTCHFGLDLRNGKGIPGATC